MTFTLLPNSISLHPKLEVAHKDQTVEEQFHNNYVYVCRTCFIVMGPVRQEILLQCEEILQTICVKNAPDIFRMKISRVLTTARSRTEILCNSGIETFAA